MRRRRPRTVLCMDAHAPVVVRYFYQLWQRTKVTSNGHCGTVVFIASQVDCCSGVLCGMLAVVIRRLQMILNAAVRLIVGAGKFQHITPVLRDGLKLTTSQSARYSANCCKGRSNQYRK